MTTHLLVPGLFGPLPKNGDLAKVPRLEHIEQLLSKGVIASYPGDYPGVLARLFGMQRMPHADWPTAAVCAQAEAGLAVQANAFLLHADPLHLRPDQDRLLAFDFHHQSFSTSEAQQLVAAFNQYFVDDGLELLAATPTRWYLSAQSIPQLQTCHLHEVLGRNVDLFLPQGADAQKWKGWMNEAQMLFHSQTLNVTREADGLLPVNGLWLSGGGVLPNADLRGFSELRAENDLLAKGLQMLSQETRQACLAVDKSLERAVMDGDFTTWIQALEQLDQSLRAYMEKELFLYPCAGEQQGQVWHWKPAMRRRIWRRRKSLLTWLDGVAA